MCVLSCVQHFTTFCTLAHQAPLSMGFSSHESWNRLMFRPLGDLPDQGLEFCLWHLLLCRQILTAEKSGTLILYWFSHLPLLSLGSALSWVCVFLSPLLSLLFLPQLFTRPPQTALCLVSFPFLGGSFDLPLLYSVMNLHP